MSMKIDLSKELTDEQVAFLESRGARGAAKLKQNQDILAQEEYYAKKMQERATSEEEEQQMEHDPDEMSDEDRAETLKAAQDWIANAKSSELKERLAEWELDTDGKIDVLRTRLYNEVEKRYAPREPAPE